jgi:MFS family permease
MALTTPRPHRTDQQPRTLRWIDHVWINIYWFGLNVSAGIITPVLLPYLVALFVAQEEKNSYLALLRVSGLAVAMLVQPLAGLLSDRSTLRFGRRRPFIFWGTLFDLLFLAIIGSATLFLASDFGRWAAPLIGIPASFLVLMVGLILLMVSSNVAQGAMQGLLPDLVPEGQRGLSSGYKAAFELLPAFLVIFIGPLVDAGRIWLTVAVIGTALTLTMLLTLLFVQEQPLEEKPAGSITPHFLRLVGLTSLFVAVTRAAIWLIRLVGRSLDELTAPTETQMIFVGFTGLIAMGGSIFMGVYLGARIGIGKGAREQSPFIWWVINRLLFLAAVGSIQAFAQFYFLDVLKAENPATLTSILLGVVGVFLIPSALWGGRLADRFGRKPLVTTAGFIATAGTLLLLVSNSLPLVVTSGCVIGVATGMFMATNWAWGTDLAPPGQAGRYLGISNLAGAGAGIVGAGIGGPLADLFNRLEPGLGYQVIFAIYAGLLLLSVVTVRWIPETRTAR